jgi:hypothetical protein
VRNLRLAFLHVGHTASKRGSCRLMYDLRRDKLYLLSNVGTRWLGGHTPGSAQVIRNRQCTLHCSKTAVTKRGRLLKVSWNLVFRASFRGEKQLFLSCTDRRGARAAWEIMGTWQVR